MFRTTRIALATGVVGFTVLGSMSARADVMSTIKAQCATLGATQYEIAFVTADGSAATSTNIQDYNNFVAAEAALGSSYLSDFVPGATTWTDIGSTPSTNALANATYSPTIPVFDTQGALIASAGTALWNTLNAPLINPINYTQYGDAANANFVWTGTSATGSTYYPLGGTEMIDSGPYVDFGMSFVTNGDWTQGPIGTAEPSTAPLYALSSPINVPEPSSITLVGSALLGLAVAAYRRRNWLDSAVN